MLRGFLLVTYCGLASCLQAGNIFFPSRGRNRLGIHPATRHLTVMLASADDSSSSDPREATSHTNPSSPSAEIQGTKKAAGFPILSLQVLLMGVIFGQAANGLSTVVPLFLEATEASRSSFALPIVLNLGLMGWASLELGKNFGFLGKEDYYDRLKGEEVNSFAREAAAWALAGEVPVRSKDGVWEVATFAGGCFWGTELHFQRLPGVVATCVGYTQGEIDKPSYGQVCSGLSGHTEGLQLTYDPAVVSYAALCDKLLSTVDATARNRVGNDRGTQYRHGIYPHTAEQRRVAEQRVAAEQTRLSKPVVTEVVDAEVFWPAEPRHQRYLERGGQSAAKECTERVRCYG